MPADWKNELYHVDNPDILPKYVLDESADLVPLDPPLRSNSSHNVLFCERNGTQPAAQLEVFRDTRTRAEELLKSEKDSGPGYTRRELLSRASRMALASMLIAGFYPYLKVSESLSSLSNDLLVLERQGPISLSRYSSLKDVNPLKARDKYHFYGTGYGNKAKGLEVFHATSDSLNSQWIEQEPVDIEVQGPAVCAPGVIYDDQEDSFHMFIQTAFQSTEGTIEYLLSKDGQRFTHRHTALKPDPDMGESVIYDASPAVIGNKKYLVYSGGVGKKRGEICLAESATNTWSGPWDRLGRILSASEVPFHNQDADKPTYEWGLEGPQLVELPDGLKLLTAVGFLSGGQPRTKQRVFFALSEAVRGPFVPLGPVLDPRKGRAWEQGENGHGGVLANGSIVELFYQARARDHGKPWLIGRASIPLEALAERWANL